MLEFAFLLFLSTLVEGKQIPYLNNVEVNEPLWSLIRAESMADKPFTPGLRRRGDFRGKNLRGFRASRLDLSRFDFRDSDLRGAEFIESLLLGTDFRGADLRQAVFASTHDFGALFNQKTRLPFSEEDAIARGWTKVGP